MPLNDHPVRQRLADVEEERESVIKAIGIATAHSPRIAFSRAEAAEKLGVSVEFFERYVAPEIRCIRRGRRVLYTLGELLFWIWVAAEPHADHRDAIQHSATEDPAA